MNTMKPGSDWFFIVSVLTLHLFYFLWQVIHGNYLLSDSFEYLMAASNIREEFLLYCGDLEKVVNYDLFTKRPPVYPLFLAACQWISSGFVFVTIVQNALSIFSLLLVRSIFIQLGYSTKYDLLFVFLLIFSPAQYIYANMIMSETLLQFLIIIAFWSFTKFIKSGLYIYSIAYGVAIFLCLLTKPVFTYFIYVNLLFFIWLAIKRSSFKPILVSLIPLLFLLGYQYRNYNATGVFETSSIARINLLDYNTRHFLINTVGYDESDSIISDIKERAKQTLNYKQEAAFIESEAIGIISRIPLSYALFHLKGIFGFFLDPGRFDMVNFFNPDFEKGSGLLLQLNKYGLLSAVKYLFGHSFLLVAALFAVGLAKLFKLILFLPAAFRLNKSSLSKGFVALLIVYTAVLTGPLGASRFFMPLEPLYLGFVLLFVSEYKNKDNTKVNRE